MCSVPPHLATDASTYNLKIHELQLLSQKSIEAKDLAYCPYSKFRVGATVLMSDGEFVSGANVENASFPVGLCAERCAIAKALTEGKGKREFRALAVATDISPPGRELSVTMWDVIREVCPISLPIFMHDKDEKYVVKTLEELLPMSFGPEDLRPAGEKEE